MKIRSIASPLSRWHARTVLSVSLMAGGALVGGPANAAITFTFDYAGGDPTSVGFDDPVNGAARRSALENAATLFSNYFGSLFSNTGTILLKVESTNTPLPGTLAYAGSFQEFPPSGGFGNSEVIRNILVNGTDINGAAADGVVGVNWGAPWELDPNTPVSTTPASDFDFYAALFHEFTHAVGFASRITEEGTDGTDRGPLVGGVDYGGYWGKFDEFMTNCAGSDLIDHGSLLTNQPTYDNAKTSAMCFSGASAKAANGNADVALYAPNPYSPGSSGSHVDGVGPNVAAMMKYDRDYDIDEARTYNAIEVGILTDIGYTRALASIPEPSTLLLVGAALGGLGLSRRRT